MNSSITVLDLNGFSDTACWITRFIGQPPLPYSAGYEAVAAFWTTAACHLQNIRDRRDQLRRLTIRGHTEYCGVLATEGIVSGAWSPKRLWENYQICHEFEQVFPPSLAILGFSRATQKPCAQDQGCQPSYKQPYEAQLSAGQERPAPGQWE
jgi:hypothetical protein